jgi:class 3 adenylate cyclase
MGKEGSGFNPEGEYKKLTVMFVDMRGFSHLLMKQVARRVIKLLDLYFNILVTSIHEHGGVVDKYMGDGLMAVWGLPAGSADDAYRAARAAVDIRLGMFRIIPELVRLGEVPLEIGIGLGTGPALVGFVGPRNRRAFTLVGNCINKAARLQGVASNNRIFIDSSTAEELRHCSCTVLAPGKTLPELLKNSHVYELEGIYEHSPEFESSRRYPRVLAARVAGITKIRTSARKPALIKTIGEGGLGLELHDSPEFQLRVGDELMFDSSDLRFIKLQDTRGRVVRMKELKAKGIFKVRTWDVGVKFSTMPEDSRSNLSRIRTGVSMMQDVFKPDET